MSGTKMLLGLVVVAALSHFTAGALASAVGMPESAGRRFMTRELARQGFERRFASCGWTSNAPGRETWKCRWRGRRGTTICRGFGRVTNFYTPPATFTQTVRITVKHCVVRS